MPLGIRNRTFEKNRSFYAERKTQVNERNDNELKCSVKLISGCQDNQLSADGAFNGLFTANLLSVWRSGVYEGNYQKSHRKIVESMPPDQTPNLPDIGKSNPTFDNQPFVI